MKIGLTDDRFVLANCVNLKELWCELSRKMQLVQEDVVIKDQLDEAIASISLL